MTFTSGPFKAGLLVQLTAKQVIFSTHSCPSALYISLHSDSPTLDNLNNASLSRSHSSEELFQLYWHHNHNLSYKPWTKYINSVQYVWTLCLYIYICSWMHCSWIQSTWIQIHAFSICPKFWVFALHEWNEGKNVVK